jgi:5-formyltetrahydrofolate cyclo-ligase family
MAMLRGEWTISVLPTDAEALTPGIALAPLVGRDGAGFRLGYSGGYFDRPLASLAPPPFTIGIGQHFARLATVIGCEVVAGKKWRNLVVLVMLGVLAPGNTDFHREAAQCGYAAECYAYGSGWA